MLQEGEANQGHQRMAVEAAPGSTLEVVESEFFLELLVGLLARPARLDRRRECPKRRLRRVIGQVIPDLASVTSLGD